jgi:hypothetical protein
MSPRRSPTRITYRAFAAVCIAGLAACYSSVSYPDGVIVDAVKYEKAAFFRGPAMNLVFDLRQGDFDGDGADDILAVGEDGAHILAVDGREKRLIAFRAPEPPWAVRLLAGSGDGKLRFLGNLPKAAQTVLLDHTGAMAWKAPGSYYGTPVAADLDGDGRAKILSPTDRGIDVRSADGAMVRQFTAAGKPLQFDATDIDGDGRAEVVTGNWESSRLPGARWRNGRHRACSPASASSRRPAAPAWS